MAADGATQVIEGDADFRRTVILRFESEEQCRAWYDSPAYQQARTTREGAVAARITMVKGLG
ncbi:MAG: DUF1330 domain-containing protein [Steroidobacteraceae bacterium]